jgi:hypothetical protein
VQPGVDGCTAPLSDTRPLLDRETDLVSISRTNSVAFRYSVSAQFLIEFAPRYGLLWQQQYRSKILIFYLRERDMTVHYPAQEGIPKLRDIDCVNKGCTKAVRPPNIATLSPNSFAAASGRER